MGHHCGLAHGGLHCGYGPCAAHLWRARADRRGKYEWGDPNAAKSASSQKFAMSCNCANACAVHGHDHALAWSSHLPIVDLKSFWGDRASVQKKRPLEGLQSIVDERPECALAVLGNLAGILQATLKVVAGLLQFERTELRENFPLEIGIWSDFASDPIQPCAEFPRPSRCFARSFRFVTPSVTPHSLRDHHTNNVLILLVSPLGLEPRTP
jgi:hypothetical protein